jgi:hypothetical protein
MWIGLMAMNGCMAGRLLVAPVGAHPHAGQGGRHHRPRPRSRGCPHQSGHPRLVSTGEFEHAYQFKDGLVERMDLRKL